MFLDKSIKVKKGHDYDDCFTTASFLKVRPGTRSQYATAINLWQEKLCKRVSRRGEDKRRI